MVTMRVSYAGQHHLGMETYCFFFFFEVQLSVLEFFNICLCMATRCCGRWPLLTSFGTSMYDTREGAAGSELAGEGYRSSGGGIVIPQPTIGLRGILERCVLLCTWKSRGRRALSSPTAHRSQQMKRHL